MIQSSPRLDVRELEAPLRRAVPEIARWPLYIVGPAEFGRWFGGWARRSLHGFTMAHLDLAIRPHLEREGSWRGRGPAVFIDPPTCLASELARRSAAGLVEPGPAHLRLLARRTALATALHELAHAHQPGHGWQAPAPPGAELPAMQAGLAAWAPTAETKRPRPSWPWRHHGPRFLRLAACLAERAGAPLEEVVDFATYELDGSCRLREELRRDARRMAPVPLATVARLRLSPGILAGWREALAERSRIRFALAAERAFKGHQPHAQQRRAVA